MNFSCKISSAVISYLEKAGEDLTLLYEQFPLPMEILKDSSSWLVAHDMETLLRLLHTNFQHKFYEKIESDSNFDEETFYQKIGHQSADLKAWGVLDHVLRMMPKPHEIFHHPESFIAYFVSPKPPIENFQKKEDGICFDWPLLSEQFPFVSEYLQSAFESIPTYVGLHLATCTWEGIHFQLSWKNNQNSFLSEKLGHQVSPELFNHVIQELQKQQAILEEQNQSLLKQNEELNRKFHLQAKGVLSKQIQFAEEVAPIEILPEEREQLVDFSGTKNTSSFQSSYFQQLSQNMARLNDYMYRAQQVITILSQLQKTPQTKQILKKVDWDHIRKQFPFLLQDSFHILRQIDQERVRFEQQPAHDIYDSNKVSLIQ